jgi:hypothetical protein
MRKGTYRKQPNISIDTLFDFFKTLNQNPTNDGDGATVQFAVMLPRKFAISSKPWF